MFFGLGISISTHNARLVCQAQSLSNMLLLLLGCIPY